MIQTRSFDIRRQRRQLLLPKVRVAGNAAVNPRQLCGLRRGRLTGMGSLKFSAPTFSSDIISVRKFVDANGGFVCQFNCGCQALFEALSKIYHSTTTFTIYRPIPKFRIAGKQVPGVRDRPILQVNGSTSAAVCFPLRLRSLSATVRLFPVR